jgi:hypothetical protein
MTEQKERSAWRRLPMLAACVLLVACAAGPRPPRQYGWTMDSVSNACLKNTANCPPVVGQQPATVSAASGSLVGAAVAGGVLIERGRGLEEEETAAINKALEECADEARSEVMLKYFENGRPTREECEEVMGTDRRGQPITRAMQLGLEQHEVALRCAEEQLSKIKPGGFILSPRYRYDPNTGKTEYLPREVVEELLRQGRSEELRGTLEPDIVIHDRDLRRVQDAYDFKFPCMNTGSRIPWRQYPQGHSHSGRSQGQLYKDALKVDPARVQPHVGVGR